MFLRDVIPESVELPDTISSSVKAVLVFDYSHYMDNIANVGAHCLPYTISVIRCRLGLLEAKLHTVICGRRDSELHWRRLDHVTSVIEAVEVTTQDKSSSILKVSVGVKHW